MLKKRISVLLTGIFIFFPVILHGEESESYIPKYQTIAHDILKIESEAVDYKPNFQLLDSIIDEVKSRTDSLQKPYSKEDAIIILQHIAIVLLEKNFRYGETFLLIEACKQRKFQEECLQNHIPEANKKDLESYLTFYIADCDTLSFLYLGVGEALNFPLYLVCIPNHAFITWIFPDDDHLIWDAAYINKFNPSFYLAMGILNHRDISRNDYFQFLKRNEVFSLVYKNRGGTWDSKGEYDKAIADYNKALEINPKYAEAFVNRGNTWNRKGEYDKAIADYDKALEISPKLAEVFNNRGSAWYSKGEYDKAITDYDKALEISPKLAEAFNGRGNAWNSKGEYDKAIEDCNKALEINLKYAEAFGNRGNAWYSKGEYDKAIADYDKALEISPKLAEAFYNRGNAWYSKGEYDKAIADFDKALEINPKYAEAFYNRGTAWYSKGEYDKAIADYNKALEINPKFEWAFNNRGSAWHSKGEYDKAIEDCNKALEINPKDALIYSNIGCVYFEGLYNFPKAYELFETAYHFDPKDSSVVSNFAAANLATERYDIANDLANEILLKHDVKNEVKIAMKLITVITLMIQKKEYTHNLQELTDFYKNLSDYNPTLWTYKGTKVFINGCKALPDKEKDLILAFIAMVELPKAEGLGKIKEIEDSLSKRKSQ